MANSNSNENDPDTYCEEWFNIAILSGKEFQLPNLTSPILNFLTENFEISETQIPTFIRANPLEQNVSSEDGYSKIDWNLVVLAEEMELGPPEVRLFDLNFEPRNEIYNFFLRNLDEKNTQEGGEKRKLLSDQNDSFPSNDAPGNHKCFICNLKFYNGNALGGHMSAHAKKRKLEAVKAGIFRGTNRGGPTEKAISVKIEDNEGSSQQKGEELGKTKAAGKV